MLVPVGLRSWTRNDMQARAACGSVTYWAMPYPSHTLNTPHITRQDYMDAVSGGGTQENPL